MSTPINIKIDSETYSAYPQRIIIGHRGDVRVRQLVFDADVIAGISQYYVRFLIPDGETVYENALQNVTSSDKKHTFQCDVPAAVTALTGEGYLQWVARTSNGTTIAKSDMVRFTVLESVSDETEPIPTPETTEAAVDRVEKAAEDAIKTAEEAKKAAEEAAASGTEQPKENKVTKIASGFLGVVVLIALAAGGGFYAFAKQKQKKQAEKEALDPDANYTEDKGNFEIPVEDEPEETGEEDKAEE